MGFLWIHSPRLNPYLKDSVAARRMKTISGLFGCFCQAQAERIEAIAQVSWSVKAFAGKDVTEVRFAVCTQYFDSCHPQGGVFDVGNFLVVDGSVKRRPTATGIEFRVGLKELFTTGSARVRCVVDGVRICSSVWTLRTCLTRNLESFRTEPCLPLLM